MLGATLMIAAAAGISTTQGTGWIIPMTILLSIVLGVLSFSVLTAREEKSRGSTPLSIQTMSGGNSLEPSVEDLPDPNQAGFDLPIL